MTPTRPQNSTQNTFNTPIIPNHTSTPTTQNHTNTPIALNINNTAKTLGVSTRTIWNLIKQNKIQTIHIGKRTLIPTECIKNFVSQLLEQNNSQE
ncbi:MAG: helix-turn-helix domain-containing protein [Planctomycetaceae bacterium]|nr:helix-turn-helix domain-containing protein [Planctomycetaceae bacterium]